MATQPRTSKVSFMLPPDLHRRLRIAAAEEGIRLSALVTEILGAELGRDAPEDSQRDPGDETD